jgi:histidyl-tRNA synthetase
VEAIGSDDPAVDAEVIQLYSTLLTRLGVTDYRLVLNSIGCRECRPAYVELLTEWLRENRARLDQATRAKADANPLRVFDNLEAKPAAVQAVLREAPTIGDSLCDACKAHFAEVRRHLDAVAIVYELEPMLVRGLDYYTRTTWEFVGPDEGAQSSLSGGGRYDGLVEDIGGPATPAVGFGAGIERLLLALELAGVTAPGPAVDVFFAVLDGAPRERVAVWLRDLRAQSIPSDTDYAGRSLKGQLTQAARLGAATVVVVGPDSATIRRPEHEDEEIAHEDLPSRLGL